MFIHVVKKKIVQFLLHIAMDNQIMRLPNDRMVNANCVPILVDGKPRGVVATLQDIRQVQSSEQKIRLKLHEKGLVAKYTLEDILGSSPEIRKTVRAACSFAATQAAVLICGETGTGKELFAQGIHNASGRREGPFVAINCAAVNSSLLESELFGYEANAFTGASKNGREGLFELAHGGTIFLDEIGEIPRETQVELLRVLQEKEVRRVGGNRVIPVDVRILTATNRNLFREVLEGRFREDLYYRLGVLTLELPPLRARSGDIPLIGLHFFRRLPGGEDPARQAQFLQLLACLGDYPWRGNIRELQNFAERTCILLSCGGDADAILADTLRGGAPFRPVSPRETARPDLPGRAAQLEKITEALRSCPDSMEKAARSLGCSRQTLWRWMKALGITRPQPEQPPAPSDSE